jgi:hypothetical protein
MRSPHKPLIKLATLRAAFIMVFGENNPAGYWVGPMRPEKSMPARWYPHSIYVDVTDADVDLRRLRAVLKTVDIRMRNVTSLNIVHVGSVSPGSTRRWRRFYVKANRFSEYYGARFRDEAVLDVKSFVFD